MLTANPHLHFWPETLSYIKPLQQELFPTYTYNTRNQALYEHSICWIVANCLHTTMPSTALFVFHLVALRFSGFVQAKTCVKGTHPTSSLKTHQGRCGSRLTRPVHLTLNKVCEQFSQKATGNQRQFEGAC